MAILVGLPKAPSTYAPTKNYEISMGRANRVVSRMYKLGWIDETTYKKALAENPKVYDDTLTQNKAPFIVDEVMRRAKEMGITDLKTGGYEITTTVDLQLQDIAKESLHHAYDLALQRIQKYKVVEQEKRKRAKRTRDEKFVPRDVNGSKLNGALVSLDSKTGDILALVGSVDYKTSSYNRATQGRRQPGSAFKPFIYQVAIDLGYSGATKLVDIAKTYEYEKNGEEMKWRPKNYEKNYEGLISLRDALVHSRNLATINLVNDIGLGTLLRELKKFRIKNIPKDLSISLGTMSLSPLELAQYYTTFSNYGTQVDTHLIYTIRQNNEELYTRELSEHNVTLPTQAFIMTTILRDVVKRGTGRRARAKAIEVAGKTGTTNKNVDAWFAGYNPTIETVVWFGNDDNTPMYHKETGGRVAGPAFSMYNTKLVELYPQIPRKFEAPEGIIEVDIHGEKEYFSTISKPPRQKEEVDPQEELLF